MSPEFFHFADQIIEQALARRILIVAGPATSSDTNAGDATDDVVELAARPDLGDPPFWPAS